MLNCLPRNEMSIQVDEVNRISSSKAVSVFRKTSLRSTFHSYYYSTVLDIYFKYFEVLRIYFMLLSNQSGF
jgi:hypothetical protein